MPDAARNQTEFQSAVDKAVVELVQREHFHDHAVVTLPVFLPTGSSVLVEIWGRRASFLVTDGGSTWQEAVLMGEERSFARAAEKVAADEGVELRDRAFRLDGVPADRLAGAIGSVADCAKQAMERVAVSLEGRHYGEGGERLVAKLVEVFSEERVERGASVAGASTHPWPVTAIVRAGGRPTVFEAVTAHHSAIASTVTKFHDIARLDDPPKRVSVVRDKRELGDLLAVLQQASDVIDEAVAPDRLRRLVGEG